MMAEHPVDPDRAGHLRTVKPPEVATSVTNSIFVQHGENDELGRR
jgi:hypothetical protein